MWKTNALCCGRIKNKMSLPQGTVSSGRDSEIGKGMDTIRWWLSLRLWEEV